MQRSRGQPYKSTLRSSASAPFHYRIQMHRLWTEDFIGYFSSGLIYHLQARLTLGRLP